MAPSYDDFLAAQMLSWPEPYQTWYGGEFPSRPKPAPRPLLGWVCSGCRRGFAPHVRSCDSCGPLEQVVSNDAAGVTVGVSRRLDPSSPVIDAEDEQ